MTCLEKLRELKPGLSELELGIIVGEDCPNDYGIHKIYCGKVGYDCRICWDREIPETLPMQYKIDVETEKELNDPEPMWPKENPHILDSGDRTQFESGAVRDMREGKGRCDLVPLEVMAELLADLSGNDVIIDDIGYFMKARKEGDHESAAGWLYAAIHNFVDKEYGGCMYTALLEVSKHFEEGAKKYGEDNWRKSIPVWCYIDSAIRHYLKHRRGDKDEPHNLAFIWNLMCCIWEVDHSGRNQDV